MKSTLHVPLSVDEAVKKISESLIGNGFIFSEEDGTYVVRYSGKKAEKTKNWSRFWSRRSLGDKYPQHYSIVIQGTVREENRGSIIDLEIIEYHAGREHTYGGTMAITEYFEKFCDIFEEKST